MQPIRPPVDSGATEVPALPPHLRQQSEELQRQMQRETEELQQRFSKITEQIAADRAARESKQNAPLWVPVVLLLAIGILLAFTLRWARRQQSRQRKSSPPPSAAEQMLSAYRNREFDQCAACGAQLLLQSKPHHHVQTSVALLTIIAMRKAGRAEEGEALSVELLKTNWGPEGELLYFMRILDGDLTAERFLSNLGPDTPSASDELECRSHFYEAQWLHYQEDASACEESLQRCLSLNCDIPESYCAAADLAELRQ